MEPLKVDEKVRVKQEVKKQKQEAKHRHEKPE